MTMVRHIPSKTALLMATRFVSATQPEQKDDKQHEVDMPNMNPQAILLSGHCRWSVYLYILKVGRRP